MNLKEIFESHLKGEHSLVSIKGLLNKDRNIEYDPYYQREFIWNNDKTSSLIESILLGTDIPPLVFFQESDTLEIIDGRQRFEAIKKFINNEFKLKNNGLSELKRYANLYYENLPEDIRELLLNTKLRIFTYSPVGELINDEKQKDIIKKEIFTRYNSGMTPLKVVEVDRALYIEDDLNTYIKKKIQSSSKLKESLFKILMPQKFLKHLDSSDNLERLLKKIRFLLVIDNIPIYYYSWSKGRNDLINKFFEKLSSETTNPEEVYNKLVEKINILNKLYKEFVKKKRSFNYLVFESLFWMTSILEKEGYNLDYLTKNEFISTFAQYISKNTGFYTIEQSHYYKNTINRYNNIVEFFKELYPISFDLYLITSEESKEKVKEIKNLRSKKELNLFVKSLREAKPDPYTIDINELVDDISKTKFILRPSYQRMESMSISKASALIESILLGFKIAPIYTYIRKNNVKEVIDGQQRILAILAYMGVPFMNQNGEKEFSTKNEFALSGLKYLDNFNTKKFSQLEIEDQNKIKNFVLSIIEINSKTHPDFNPVDLFVRLNKRPYPIKQNSFEMWNATIDIDIIRTIKEKTKKFSDWFYIRTKNSNKRMQNEELYTNLVFLEYKRQTGQSLLSGNTCDQFIIFAKETKLACYVKNKSDITEFLEGASENNDKKALILQIIFEVENYIDKVETLINKEDSSLKIALDNLLKQKGGARTLQTIFLLWYILSPINKEKIEENRSEVYSQIEKIIGLFKQEYEPLEKEAKFKEFKEYIRIFGDKFISADMKNREIERV